MAKKLTLSPLSFEKALSGALEVKLPKKCKKKLIKKK